VSTLASVGATAHARRMRLRPERPWQEHAHFYEELFADPAVAATLWPGAHGGPRSPAQASSILASDILHWHEQSFGPWVFFDTSSGAFVGRGGLRYTTALGEETVELLYAVRSELWGRGYATEIATIAMARARALGLDEVIGITATTNNASRRVLERVGIRFTATLQHAGLPHWLGRSRTRP
jgi:[ribosomal protein S5]-alanine N-acetyltransferase